jgi:hypothetical protein
MVADDSHSKPSLAAEISLLDRYSYLSTGEGFFFRVNQGKCEKIKRGWIIHYMNIPASFSGRFCGEKTLF